MPAPGMSRGRCVRDAVNLEALREREGGAGAPRPITFSVCDVLARYSVCACDEDGRGFRERWRLQPSGQMRITLVRLNAPAQHGKLRVQAEFKAVAVRW